MKWREHKKKLPATFTVKEPTIAFPLITHYDEHILNIWSLIEC